MAVSVLHSHKIPAFTKSENKMARRYRVLREEQVIPKFWTKRPWDSPEDVMDVESSLNLKSQIRNASRGSVQSKRSEDPAQPPKRVIPHKPKPRPDPEPRPKPRTEAPEMVERIRKPIIARSETPQKPGFVLSEELLARLEQRLAFQLSLPARLYGTDASSDDTDIDVF
jgi:hypothetical protein